MVRRVGYTDLTLLITGGASATPSFARATATTAERAKDREDLEELDAGLTELERHKARVRGKMLEP